MDWDEIYLKYKQAIDTFAHIIVGAAVTWVLAIAWPTPLAFIVMMCAAIGREYLQHNGFNFKLGTYLDLAGFAVGGFIGVLLA